MRKIHCINAISKYGTDQFTEDYELTDEVNEAEGILVRSASLHEMQFSNSLLVLPAPEPVSTIFRWMPARRRALLCLTLRVPMQMA